MYYSVVKEHKGNVENFFIISQVFSDVQSVLSQCNTQLRLLHLLYDIEVTWRKTITHTFFYVLYSDETWVFDQSEGTQGPIYIIIKNNSTNFGQVVCYFQSFQMFTKRQNDDKLWRTCDQTENFYFFR